MVSEQKGEREEIFEEERWSINEGQAWYICWVTWCLLSTHGTHGRLSPTILLGNVSRTPWLASTSLSSNDSWVSADNEVWVMMILVWWHCWYIQHVIDLNGSNINMFCLYRHYLVQIFVLPFNILIECAKNHSFIPEIQ